jgi:hypothetical protein
MTFLFYNTIIKYNLYKVKPFQGRINIMWSKELIKLSKEYFQYSGTSVKNLNGDFGILDIDLENQTYKVLPRDETTEAKEYKSIDEMIKAGWAVD